MKYNFSDVLLLNGKTRRFLRFYNEGNDISLKCDVVFIDTAGSPSSQITINNQPIYAGYCSKPITVYKKSEVAFMIEYDGIENISAKLIFSIEGSPSESKELILYGLKDERETHIAINDLPIDENIKYDMKSSYLLMRTNPRLTGNVKLIVDSNSNLALNIIDAKNGSVHKNYKKNIRYLDTYFNNIYDFYKDTKSLFYVSDEGDYSSAPLKYSEERNDIYSYGVSQCISESNDEEFSIFAPIWLTKQIPEFFVIFKADHPISKESYISNDDKKIFSELIKDAEIIKTFDLRENTKLGTYLRSIVNDANFTENPISVNFGANNDTLALHGISLNSGVMVNGLISSDFSLKNDMRIKEFEEQIIESFKKNEIVACNIINLEFLFDDKDSPEYSINRYFGLYVDAINLGECEFSNELLSRIDDTLQYPKSIPGVTAECYSTIRFTQYNDNGIILPIPYKHPLPSGNDIKNETRIFAIKDRDNNMHRIKSSDEHYDFNGNIDAYNFHLYDKKLDITKMCGIYDVKFSGVAKLNSAIRSQMQLALYDTNNDGYIFNPGDKLEISIENGNSISEKFCMIANETDIDTGDCWKFPVYDSSENAIKGMFNPKGTPEQVAQAIARCVNAFNSLYFKAMRIDNSVAIVCYKDDESGNSLRMTKILTNERNRENCRFFDLYSGNDMEFCGGNKTKNNVAVITNEQSKSLIDDIYFQVKSGKFSKIKNYGSKEMPVLSIPDVSKAVFEDDKLVSIEGYNEGRIVTIEDEVPFYTDNESHIVAYNIYKPYVSIFSIYPVKDFDFDFYSSDYNEYRRDELLSYYNVITLKSGEKATLDKNEIYEVKSLNSSDCELEIKNAYHEDGSPSQDFKYKNGDFIETYTILNREVECIKGNARILKYKYNSHNDENDDNDDNEIVNSDITNFKGFVGIATDKKSSEKFNAYLSASSFDRFDYDKISSEYDRLKENDSSELAFKSKVVPTIVKWIADGSDARDNNYRLNFSSAFGETNFSPDLNSLNDSDKFTHEWYYLSDFPKNYSEEAAGRSYSYMYGKLTDSYKDKKYYTLERLLLDDKIDYFTKFFVKGYNYTKYRNSKDYKKERYTFCKFVNEDEHARTLFHGIKVRIIEKNKAGEIDTTSKHYDGYKFSVILSPIEDYAKEPYKVVLYDNKVFKTLLFVVKVPLIGDSFKNSMSYMDLYNSNSFYDYCNLKKDENPCSYKTLITYADTKMCMDIASLRTPSDKTGHNNILETTYGISKKEVINVNCGLKDSVNQDKLIMTTGYPSFAWIEGEEVTYALFHKDTQVNDINREFKFNEYKDAMSCMSSKYGFDYNEKGFIARGHYELYKICGGQNANFNNEIISINSIKNIIEKGDYEYKTNNFNYSPKIALMPYVKCTINHCKNAIEKSVQTSTVIGSNADYTIENTDNSIDLYRYPYSYRPKFKDVIEFAANSTSEIVNKFGKDLLLCNTDIFNDADSFNIKNYQYCKIGSNAIRKDEVHANHGLYDLPAIGEISVAMKDVSIAKSNWDNAYYTKYDSSKISSEVPGTIDKNATEKKSFFGSKVMNVPISFEFTSYNNDEYECISKEKTEANSVLTNVTNTQIKNERYDTIKIDMEKVLFNAMLSDGILNEIDWIRKNVKTDFTNMTKDQIIEYIKNYYNSNIKGLYKTKTIKIYTKVVKEEDAGFINDYNIDMIKYQNYNGKIIYQNYNEKTTSDSECKMDGDLNFTIDVKQLASENISYFIYTTIERK